MRSSLDRNKSWESATLLIGADHIGTSFSREVEIPPGSQEHGARTWGHPEPGRSRRFHQERGKDNPPIKSRRYVGCATQRANTRTDGDTAERRKRSEAG